MFSTRYVGFFTFALNYSAHGLNVWGYHAVNLLVHIINALLVYTLVRFLLRTPALRGTPISGESPLVALLSALLFALHPLQTQAVTYIVQRLASLGALFYIAAVVLYLRYRLSGPGSGRRLWYAGMFLCVMLAMFTKEFSITLPVMLILVEIVFFDGPLRRRLLALVPVAVTLFVIPVTILAAAVTEAGFVEGVARSTRLESQVSRLEYLYTQFNVVARYIRLLIAPYGQNLDYDQPVYRSFSQPEVFLPFIFLAFLFCGARFMVYRGIRKHGSPDPSVLLASFGALWFFIAISVESSVLPIKDVIFEHRVYLPSVGAMLALSVAFFTILRRTSRAETKLALAAGVSVVVVFLGIFTYARNNVWRSEISLWSDVVSKSPGKARGHHNLAVAYDRKGKYEKAVDSFDMAITLDPGNARV
jgi:hypothetical protein